jgi:hypothetical protein
MPNCLTFPAGVSSGPMIEILRVPLELFDNQIVILINKQIFS